jgi:hypothetical protein
MSAAGMKTAAFTVRADGRQWARWKRAAEGEGFQGVGQWAALALDAYLEMRRGKAGTAVPLAWRNGHFSALVGGELVTVAGFLSPPFGAFAGTEEGPASYQERHRYTLAYLPDGRILATLGTYKACKALASELARSSVRWGGKEPPGRPAGEIIRAFR